MSASRLTSRINAEGLASLPFRDETDVQNGSDGGPLLAYGPIIDQETAFLKALQTPATVETRGATVTLRDASGATPVLPGTN
jgi:hypothetical protein